MRSILTQEDCRHISSLLDYQSNPYNDHPICLTLIQLFRGEKAMSRAGIYSNRGDYYQLLIGMDWLITMLEGREGVYEIQVDSIGLPEQTKDEERVLVDDVVVCYDDDTLRFIQAKKNQSNHRAWSLADLEDELIKAWKTFQGYETARIMFYSQTPFGEFNALQEAITIHKQHSIFQRDASSSHIECLQKLAKILSIPEERAFSFMTHVEIGDLLAIEGWENHLKTRLAFLFADPDRAFDTLLFSLLRHESALSGSTITITRENIQKELEDKGLFLSPYRDAGEILEEFRTVSSIGRNWPRKIAGKEIRRQETVQIMHALRENTRTILVQGGPGSGKTCILLDIAEAIERDPAFALLFLKADEEPFVHASSEDKIKPSDIPGKCTRLAASRRVVVIIDSLDVLSLNRKHGGLRTFLSLIDRLLSIETLSIIVSCREFDLKYDPLLRVRQWDKTVSVQDLDFDRDVAPLLSELDISTPPCKDTVKDALCTPQILKLYVRIAQEKGISPEFSTPYRLFELFTHDLIESNPSLGQPAVRALEEMAFKLLERRTSGCHRREFPDQNMVEPLCSLGVLYAPNDNQVKFAHQTLQESFSVRRALSEGMGLQEFIRALAPLPFIRASVRAFFFSMRDGDRKAFSRQVRGVLDDPDIAYHLKRLIAESLAEILPDEADRSIIRHLTENHPDLFLRFLGRTKRIQWFSFLEEHWLPYAQRLENTDLLTDFYRHLAIWQNDRPSEVYSLWLEVLEKDAALGKELLTPIMLSLRDCKNWGLPELERIIRIIAQAGSSHAKQFLGKILSRFVEATNSSDTLLWQWITRRIDGAAEIQSYNLDDFLDCSAHHFHSKDFLKQRLVQSEELLNLVIQGLWEWSKRFGHSGYPDSFLLDSSSRALSHHKSDMRHENDMTTLLAALEDALCIHSKENSPWWQKNKMILARSPSCTLRYLMIEAYKEDVLSNSDVISVLLQNKDLYSSRELDYEMGQLLNLSAPYLKDTVLEDIQNTILLMVPSPEKGEEDELWIIIRVCSLLSWIPCSYRLPKVQGLIENHRCVFYPYSREIKIIPESGWVVPPLSVETFLALSNSGILKLLGYYDKNKESNTPLVGGIESIASLLQSAAAKDPPRFLNLVPAIDIKFGNMYLLQSVISGVTDHLLYRKGNLQPPDGWQVLVEEDPLLLAKQLTGIFEQNKDFQASGSHEFHGARILEACSHVFEQAEDIEHLTELMSNLQGSADPKLADHYDSSLPDFAFGSVRGRTAESAMIVWERLLESKRTVPLTLRTLVRRFASDDHSAVRAVILRYLPFCLSRDPDLGWECMELVFSKQDALLWPYAERSFYHQYQDRYPKVKEWLERWRETGLETAGGGWGRLMTLCHLSGHVTGKQLFDVLAELSNNKVNAGVTQVFAANLKDRNFRRLCQEGLLQTLRQADMGDELGTTLNRAFYQEDSRPYITSEIALQYITLLRQSNEKEHGDHFGFLEWFAFFAREKPRQALDIGETFLSLIKDFPQDNPIYDTSSLLSALVEILKEADESDDQELIRRAIALQDGFLRHGIHDIEEIFQSNN